MKVRPTEKQLQQGVITARIGQYYVRQTKWGPVICKWPAPRPLKRTPARFYKETEFGLAAQQAADPCPYDLATAIEVAKGTTMVPRDFITAAQFGTIVAWTRDDGPQWVSYRSVTINAQLVLDQVTDTVGAMMYRSDIGWVEVIPGSNGQYLQIKDGVPTFVTVGAPGAPVPLTSAPQGITPGAGTNTAINSLTGSFHQLNVGTVVTGIAIYANAAAATSHVTPGLWLPNIGIGNPLVASGPTVIGVTKGWNKLPFSVQFLVTQSDVYAAGVQINTALFQQVNILPAIDKWVATNALPLPNPLNVTAIAADNLKVNTYLY